MITVTLVCLELIVSIVLGVFQVLTSGSAMTTSIFFSARTANSAKRLLMTNSPGLSSGSMVMLDMAVA